MSALIRRLAQRVGLVALLALGGAVTGIADDALTPPQTDAVKKLVHDYLLEHPEVIVDSLKAADERQQASAQADQQKVVSERQCTVAVFKVRYRESISARCACDAEPTQFYNGVNRWGYDIISEPTSLSEDMTAKQ